jgi:hypothetical protein
MRQLCWRRLQSSGANITEPDSESDRRPGGGGEGGGYLLIGPAAGGSGVEACTCKEQGVKTSHGRGYPSAQPIAESEQGH